MYCPIDGNRKIRPISRTNHLEGLAPPGAIPVQVEVLRQIIEYERCSRALAIKRKAAVRNEALAQ